jgi:hypothetical protein
MSNTSPDRESRHGRRPWAAARHLVYGAVGQKIWSIGIMDASPADLIAGRTGPVRWLPRTGRRHFVADPFLLPDGSALLAEGYDYARARGTILRIPIDGDAFGRAETVIDEPGCHLSYPCMIAHEGALYCVPETFERGETTIYRLSADGRSVLDRRTLIEGFAAVDPTVFEHEGRWWLAAAKWGAAVLSELFLFHGTTPLGPWTPHAANPVKNDIRGARPGGAPFRHEDALYRPAQDCSTTYGGALRLYRVTRLDTEAFAEEEVAVLRPDSPGPFPDGLHTLAVGGGRVIVDGCREVFHPLAGWYRIKARLRPRP